MNSHSDAREFDLTAIGTTIRLRVIGAGRDEVADHLLEAWRRCAVREVTETTETTATTPAILVALDPDEDLHREVWAEKGVAGDTIEAVSGVLVPAVTFHAVDTSRGQLVMIHAAGLADPETGRTAVLVGASGAGKSTACQVLGQRLGYVTDETIAIGSDLVPRKFEKPISLFPEGRTWGKHQHSPDSLGLVEPPELLSLGPIVMLKRNSSAPQLPEVRLLDTPEAIALMVLQSSYTGELDQPMHRFAEVVHAATAAVEITYREAEDLVPVITELLATPAREAQPGLLPQPPLSELNYDVAPYGLPFRRTPVVDFYAENLGGVAMTTDGRVIALSAISTRVMTLIGDDTAHVPAVAAALTDEFGVPPHVIPEGATQVSEVPDEERTLRMTDDIIAELISNGLVEHVE